MTRSIVRPDIVFSAGDLGLAQGIAPFLITRTGTDNWVNNDAINGVDPVNNDTGPGTVTPQIIVTFTTLLPAIFNFNGESEDAPSDVTASTFLGVWGSFDGSTNAPVIYPKTRNIRINQLRNAVLNGAPLP